MTVALVLLGGAVGAVIRYLVDRALAARSAASGFPWGTLLVNVVGSAGLGLFIGWGAGQIVDAELQALVATGLCASLTTFSTFSNDAAQLLRDGATRVAATYLLVTVALGLTAAATGLALGLALV